MSDAFQTQRHIQALLAGAGMHPKHRFGQHFLTDRNLMMRLVDIAELTSTDTVIEVGTGTGSLTRLLAERAGAVHTFEIDATIADIAEQELDGLDQVTLHLGDVLKSKTTLSPVLVEVLGAAAPPVKLVANLPYDIATPLLIDLLLASPPPERMCFTIQREVGERLTASPGTREYGPASVICQLFAVLERIAHVPPSAFWPRPKVDSIMLRMIPRADLPNTAARRQVADVAREGFVHRRKTMRHILAERLENAEEDRILEAIGIDARARPETLSPEQWWQLAQALPGGDCDR